MTLKGQHRQFLGRMELFGILIIAALYTSIHILQFIKLCKRSQKGSVLLYNNFNNKKCKVCNKVFSHPHPHLPNSYPPPSSRDIQSLVAHAPFQSSFMYIQASKNVVFVFLCFHPRVTQFTWYLFFLIADPGALPPNSRGLFFGS